MARRAVIGCLACLPAGACPALVRHAALGLAIGSPHRKRIRARIRHHYAEPGVGIALRPLGTVVGRCAGLPTNSAAFLARKRAARKPEPRAALTIVVLAVDGGDISEAACGTASGCRARVAGRAARARWYYLCDTHRCIGACRGHDWQLAQRHGRLARAACRVCFRCDRAELDAIQADEISGRLRVLAVDAHPQRV